MNSRRLDVEDKNMHEHKAPVSQALIPMGATRLPFNKRVMELKKIKSSQISRQGVVLTLRVLLDSS